MPERDAAHSRHPRSPTGRARGEGDHPHEDGSGGTRRVHRVRRVHRRRAQRREARRVAGLRRMGAVWFVRRLGAKRRGSRVMSRDVRGIPAASVGDGVERLTPRLPAALRRRRARPSGMGRARRGGGGHPPSRAKSRRESSQRRRRHQHARDARRRGRVRASGIRRGGGRGGALRRLGVVGGSRHGSRVRRDGRGARAPTAIRAATRHPGRPDPRRGRRRGRDGVGSPRRDESPRRRRRRCQNAPGTRRTAAR